MTVDTSLVSIVIATHNGEKHLEEALSSAFSQTHRNYEVLVVDDGSTTDRVAVICGRHRGRLKYIRQENKGLSAARNVGVRNSSGAYVAFLDDDDAWMPTKLEKQVALFEELKRAGKNPGFVYTGLQIISDEGQNLCRVLYRASGDHYKTLMFINFVGTPSAVLVAKPVLEDIGYFDESLHGVQDFDLWLRIAKKYGTHSVNEHLTKYRDREGSLSKKAPLMVQDTFRVLEKILAVEGNALGPNTKEKLVQEYKVDAALQWKNAAYESLFGSGDGKTFRKYIQEGQKIHKPLFGLKVKAYYTGSYIFPWLCHLAGRLRKKKFKDINMDVAALEVE